MGRRPYKLGNQTEFDQILRPQLAENFADLLFLLRLQLAAEAQRFLAHAVFDDGRKAVESAAADEKDVGVSIWMNS